LRRSYLTNNVECEEDGAADVEYGASEEPEIDVKVGRRAQL
jgi:hypothetical protein